MQAIDIVQPGLARIFRVAELRLRMGGASGGTARLAYLPQREAEPLRARLLRLASDGAAATIEPEKIEERVLTTVPTPQLVASIFVSDVGIAVELVFAALVVTAFLAPAAAAGIVGGGAAELIAVATLVWRRFNQEYRLTVAAAPDGLRLRSGLVALNAETIRPGRVQAVRLVEPFIWRRLGWCRLEVDLAGTAEAKGGGRGDARAAARAPPRRQPCARLRAARARSSRTRRAPTAARRGGSPGRARCATASSRGDGRTPRS